MKRVLVLTVGGLLAVVVTASWAGAAKAPPRRPHQTITFIQQISRDPLGIRPDAERDTEVEPAIAVDPNNADHVVAVFQESRFGSSGASDNGYATSQDGGQTWVTAPFPKLTITTGGKWQRASDPSVAFGPDGAVYVSSLVLANVLCPSGIAVQRSDDGGLTWNDPVTIQADGNCSVFNDKDWIAVDTNPTSPHLGRVYVVWDRSVSGFEPVVLKLSDDRGATWSTANAINSPTGHDTSAIPIVHPNGDLSVLYSDIFKSKIFSQTSTDGGITFGAPTAVTSYQGIDPPDMRTGVQVMSLSASLDPTTDTIYTVWEDGRFRSDGFNDVVLTESADEGATWSVPRRVNLDAPDSQLDHLTPAVAAFGGVVSVEYVYRDMSVGLNQIVSEHYI
ncbi:MAG TPA: sialidase family protein, partial [Actinomycetota bacterium]